MLAAGRSFLWVHVRAHDPIPISIEAGACYTCGTMRIAPKAWLLAAVTLSSAACAPPVEEIRMANPPAMENGARRDSYPFLGVRNTWLYAQRWRPEASSRAVLVVVHGLKDHSDRYADLAETLVPKGFAVYAFDLRGHGRSAGMRVWADSFDDYVDDLTKFIADVKTREPNKPVFLFGHSMGGAITTLYALNHGSEIAGLVLSAPALRANVSGFEIASTHLIDGLVPEGGIFQLDIAKFSRSKDVVEACKRDPLVFQGSGPARTAAGLVDAIDEIGKRMGELDVPLLDMHGTKDEITPPEGSKELVSRAKTTDKTLKLYDGLVHDLLHEPEKDQVTKDMTDWLVAHAPK